MLVEVGDTALFYTTLGSGTPLYLLHGGLGLDHNWFRPWLDPLSQDNQLVYFDHRGNGRSQRPDSYDAITHAVMADDIDALRAKLGHDRIVVFGHSYGGHIALEFATRHPERLAGLILSNTTAKFDFQDVAIGRAQAKSTPEQFASLVAALTSPMTDDAQMRRVWMEILPVYFAHYEAALTQPMDAACLYSAKAYMNALLGCMPSYDMLPRLREIVAPTLVLCGAHDWISPPTEGAGRLAAGIAGSELVEFANSGHFPYVEEQTRFLGVVSDWLRRKHLCGG